MVRLYALVFILQIVLAIVALIDCLSTDGERIRALPRLIWVAIILFFPLLGSIAWFLAGRPRPQSRSTGPASWLYRPAGQARRPLAPDDDPEFLRSLDIEQVRRDRQFFDQWEADLRRREEELRQRQNGEPPQDRHQPEN